MTTKKKSPIESKVKEIKRAMRRKFTAEEKIRIVLEGLRGEESISAICRKEGIHPNLYYNWSKDFLEAGKKRLNGDVIRQATSDEVTTLKEENHDLKLIVADLYVRLEAAKKNLNGIG